VFRSYLPLIHAVICDALNLDHRNSRWFAAVIAANIYRRFAAWLPPICSLICNSDCRQYARWFAAVIAANLLADLLQWLPPICSLIYYSDCRQYARWFAAWLPPICSLIYYSDCRQYARWFATVIAANMLADLLHDCRQYARWFATVIAANLRADLLQWLPPICSLICCMIAANLLADLLHDCRRYALVFYIGFMMGIQAVMILSISVISTWTVLLWFIAMKFLCWFLCWSGASFEVLQSGLWLYSHFAIVFCDIWIYAVHSSCDVSVDLSDLCLSCPALIHCYEISVLISVLKWSFEVLQSGLWLATMPSFSALDLCCAFKLWWFCRSQWSLLELSCFDSLLWNFCADFCAEVELW
jgi:hypothetical protein